MLLGEIDTLYSRGEIDLTRLQSTYGVHLSRHVKACGCLDVSSEKYFLILISSIEHKLA